MLEMDRFDFARCARPCFDQTKHTLVAGECWLGGPDLSQRCPDPECAVDGCTLDECCPACFCYCSKALDCWTETAECLDDGTVRRYCQDHKAEWVAG